MFNGRTRVWYASSANPAEAASLPKVGFVVMAPRLAPPFDRRRVVGYGDEAALHFPADAGEDARAELVAPELAVDELVEFAASGQL